MEEWPDRSACYDTGNPIADFLRMYHDDCETSAKMKTQNLKNVYGECERWNKNKGYGIVLCDTFGVGTVIVHWTELINSHELHKGDFVLMDVEYDAIKQRQKGVNVRDGYTGGSINHTKRQYL